MYNQLAIPPALEPILPFLPILAIIELILKGFALWRAAKRGQKNWFVLLLFINTMGILPAIYLFLTRKKS